MLASELKLGPALTVFLSRTAAGTDALVGLLIWPEVGGVVPGGGGGRLESVALAGVGSQIFHGCFHLPYIECCLISAAPNPTARWPERLGGGGGRERTENNASVWGRGRGVSRWGSCPTGRP